MKRRRFTEEDFDKIYELIYKNVSITDICALMKCSTSQVYYVGQAEKYVKRKNVEKVINLYTQHRELITWAQNKFDIHLIETKSKVKEESHIVDTQKKEISNDQIIIELLSKLLKELKNTNEFLETLK